MTRRIVIANLKGGVGKSTTVLNVGKALTEKGYRVLMVDLDPQAGLTASAGIDPYDLERSVYSLLLKDDVPLGRVVKPISENLLIVPAQENLTTAEILLARQQKPPDRLKIALDKTPVEFDYILIDTPPTLGTLTLNGLLAATEAIIPVQAEYLAMRGVRAVLNTIEQVQNGMNPMLTIIGIVATLYDADSRISREAIAEMRSVFGDLMFKTVVGRSDVIAEAPIEGQSVLEYTPDHAAAYAFRSLAQEIMERGEA
ncbi:MAG: ParA family protein [Chloroflexi bacterium]|nr:ParA family protein [Chloroflexota bacterium]